MDRNTLVGFGLIFAIIIGFAYFNQPSDQEVQALKRERDSIALVKQRNDSMEVALASDVQKSEEMKVVDSATMSSAFGGFSSFVNGIVFSAGCGVLCKNDFKNGFSSPIVRAFN